MAKQPATKIPDDQVPVRALIVTVCLTALLLLGFTARFFNLNNGPYWFDELIGVTVAQGPWPAFVDYIRTDAHPPLYYLGERALYHAGSTLPENTMRQISVMFGLAAVYAVWLVGRAMGGKFIGLAGAAFAAASPLLIFYSREARMYAPLILFSAISLGAFWLWLRHRQKRWLAAYLIGTSLGLLTHYSLALLVAGQTIFFLIDRRQHRINWRTGILVGTLAVLPAAIWKIYQIIGRIALHPIPVPVWYTNLNFDHWSANKMLQELVFSQYTPWTSMSSVQEEIYFLLRPLAVVALFGFLVIPVVKLFRHATPSSDHRRIIQYLTTVVALSYLVSFASKVDVTKYYLPSAIAVVLLIAFGLDYVRTRRSAVIALCLICLVSALWIPTMVKGQRYPWDQVAASITSLEQPGDAVFVHNWINTLTLNHVYRGQLPVIGVNPIPLEPRLAENAAINQYAAAKVIYEDNIDDWMTKATSGYRRIWFINENTAPFFGAQIIQKWFLDHGWVVIAEPEVQYTNSGFLSLYVRYSNR